MPRFRIFNGSSESAFIFIVVFLGCFFVSFSKFSGRKESYTQSVFTALANIKKCVILNL